MPDNQSAFWPIFTGVVIIVVLGIAIKILGWI
jgi:hypothetical protein